MERPRDRVRRALKTEGAFALIMGFVLPIAVASILLWISFHP